MFSSTTTTTTTFNHLNDDILIDIFNRLGVLDKHRLPSVCRRWRTIFEAYSEIIFSDITSLGTVVDYQCNLSDHWVYQRNTIFRLFCLPTDQSTTVLYKGRLVLDNLKLVKLLEKIPHLESLVLKYCSHVNETAINLIFNCCPNISHLDLSSSFLTNGSIVLKTLGTVASQSLTHLNLLSCDGLDEDELSYLFTKLTLLEQLIIGKNDPQLSGSCLGHVQENIKQVTLYGIDRFMNNGTRALLYLNSGHGRSIESLKLKGQLTVSLIQMIPNHFLFLSTLEVGDFFTDLWIDASHQLIGRSIGRLLNLKNLIFTLPELIQFDGNIIEIARNCPQLSSIELRGGPISDFTIEYLTNSCLNLEKLCLSYSDQFHDLKSFGPTDYGLRNICRLTRLISLTLNGTQITDNCLVEIITSCPRLSYIDVRNNPNLSQVIVAVLIECAMLKQSTNLNLFIHGTGIDCSVKFHLICPANLRVYTEPCIDQIEEDGEYDDEEFEVEDVRPQFGLVASTLAPDLIPKRINLFESDESSDED